METNWHYGDQVRDQNRLNNLRNEYFCELSYGRLADLMHKHTAPATPNSRLGFGINQEGEDFPICISDDEELSQYLITQPSSGTRSSFIKVISNQDQKREALEASGFLHPELSSFQLKACGVLNYISNIDPTRNKIHLVICHIAEHSSRKDLNLGSIEVSDYLKREISRIHSKESMQEFLEAWGTHIVTGYSGFSTFFGSVEIELPDHEEKSQIAGLIQNKLSTLAIPENLSLDKETSQLLSDYKCTYNLQVTGTSQFSPPSPSGLFELFSAYSEYCRQLTDFEKATSGPFSVIHCTPWTSLKAFLENRSAIKYLKEASKEKLEEFKLKLSRTSQEIQNAEKELSRPFFPLFSPNKAYKIMLCDNSCGVGNYFLAVHRDYNRDLRNEVSSFTAVHSSKSTSNSSWKIIPTKSGNYTIQLAQDTTTNQRGWLLSAHWISSKEYRNEEAMYAIVHSPSQRLNYEWKIEPTGEGLFTIALAKDQLFSNEDVTGWFLSCHNCYSGDRRDNNSFYTIVHKPGRGGKFWRIEEA